MAECKLKCLVHSTVVRHDLVILHLSVLINIQRTLWACWLKPGVLTLPPLALLHIYPCSFCQCCWKWILTRWEGVLRPTTRSTRCIWHLGAFLSLTVCEGWAQCMLTSSFSFFLLLSLMHLHATLKGYGLMMGDHSAYLRCSCKYSNEPSSVDGERDNGSIFYLPLLVCDSRIYLVDGIIVPKSAWFAGINFSRHTLSRCACRGKCLFIYPFVISIVILWWCCINWTASTAQQFKTQYIYYKGSVPETLLNRLTNQPKLRGEPHNNVTQSH